MANGINQRSYGQSLPFQPVNMGALIQQTSQQGARREQFRQQDFLQQDQQRFESEQLANKARLEMFKAEMETDAQMFRTETEAETAREVQRIIGQSTLLVQQEASYGATEVERLRTENELAMKKLANELIARQMVKKSKAAYNALLIARQEELKAILPETDLGQQIGAAKQAAGEGGTAGEGAPSSVTGKEVTAINYETLTAMESLRQATLDSDRVMEGEVQGIRDFFGIDPSLMTVPQLIQAMTMHDEYIIQDMVPTLGDVERLLEGKGMKQRVMTIAASGALVEGYDGYFKKEITRLGGEGVKGIVNEDLRDTVLSLMEKLDEYREEKPSLAEKERIGRTSKGLAGFAVAGVAGALTAVLTNVFRKKESVAYEGLLGLVEKDYQDRLPAGISTEQLLDIAIRLKPLMDRRNNVAEFHKLVNYGPLYADDPKGEDAISHQMARGFYAKKSLGHLLQEAPEALTIDSVINLLDDFNFREGNIEILHRPTRASALRAIKERNRNRMIEENLQNIQDVKDLGGQGLTPMRDVLIESKEREIQGDIAFQESFQ